MAGLKFVGGAGQWIPGVPARDLTAAEVLRYPRAASSPLYEALRRPRAALLAEAVATGVAVKPRATAAEIEAALEAARAGADAGEEG